MQSRETQITMVKWTKAGGQTKRANRVLKWWRHKNESSEIIGFVRIFWNNNVQEAYLPKMSISWQIVSEVLAGYTKKTPYKPF